MAKDSFDLYGVNVRSDTRSGKWWIEASAFNEMLEQQKKDMQAFFLELQQKLKGKVNIELSDITKSSSFLSWFRANKAVMQYDDTMRDEVWKAAVELRNSKAGKKSYFIGHAKDANMPPMRCDVELLVHQYPPKPHIFFETHPDKTDGTGIPCYNEGMAVIKQMLTNKLLAALSWYGSPLCCTDFAAADARLKEAKSVIAEFEAQYAHTSPSILLDIAKRQDDLAPRVPKEKPSKERLQQDKALYELLDHYSVISRSGGDPLMTKLKTWPAYKLPELLKRYDIQKDGKDAHDELLAALNEFFKQRKTQSPSTSFIE